MREIKFRGKWTYNREWVYGSLMIDKDGNQMIGSGGLVDVIPETVGQFTGLKDRNGVDIYEGDILKCHEYDSSDTEHRIVQTFENAVVGFYSGSFYYYPGGNMRQPHQLLMYAYKPVVIGNVHDNPELLTPNQPAHGKDKD